MSLTQLHNKLIAAARANPPSQTVPYAFEQRIMARLKAASIPDQWTLWSGALWRAAAPCLAIMIMLGTWSFFASLGNGAHELLSTDLENAVLAALDSPGDSW